MKLILSPSKKTLKIIFVVLTVIAVGFLLFGFIPQKITGGTATLSWNVNSEPDLAGYMIYYGQVSRTGNCPPGGYSDKLDVGKTDTPPYPSYVIKGLPIGRTYYFSVISYNTAGRESCFSAEVKKDIPGLLESYLKKF